MARKKKTDDIDGEAIRAELVTQITAMLEEEWDNLAEVLSRSKTQSVGATIHIDIDTSDQPVAESRMKYGENYTNKRVSQLDPGQGKFTAVLDEARPKGRKKDAESVDEAE